MNNKTVAICGFSMKTLPALKDSKADEIWTLNHAFVMEWAFPRFDRVFELHKRHWFLRKGLYRLEEYRKWLREPHPFPIYMQEAWKGYPASVRYPIEEIDQFVFGRLLRGTERNVYYQSSFNYILALAVYEGWSRVEVYGVDMSNDTEYTYQKPSAELMIGFALGKGVEVVLQPNSDLCIAQLYAYDRVPSADRKRAGELLALYQKEQARYLAEQNQLAELFNRRESKDASDYMKASAYNCMYIGAVEYLQRMLNGDEYYFGRQHLEDERHTYVGLEEQWLALCNEKHATFKTYSILDTDGNIGIAWKEYLNARQCMYAASGAKQTAQKLIDECDMKVVPDELRLEIVDG